LIAAGASGFLTSITPSQTVNCRSYRNRALASGAILHLDVHPIPIYDTIICLIGQEPIQINIGQIDRGAIAIPQPRVDLPVVTGHKDLVADARCFILFLRPG
jgi:hypothetical protein